MPLSEKFVKLISVILKVCEFVMGAMYLGIVLYYTTITIYGTVIVYGNRKVMSFVIVTAGFMIPTFLLILVQLHAESAKNQKKSIFEFLYNISAIVALLASSIAMLSYSERLTHEDVGRNAFRAGAIMGLLNSALYCASAVIAFVEYNKRT